MREGEFIIMPHMLQPLDDGLLVEKSTKLIIVKFSLSSVLPSKLLRSLMYYTFILNIFGH